VPRLQEVQIWTFNVFSGQFRRLMSAIVMGENRMTNNGCLHSRLGEFRPAVAPTFSRLGEMA